MTVSYDVYASSVGDLVLLASSRGLCAILFADEDRNWRDDLPGFLADAELVEDATPFDSIRRWLDAYFAGKRVGAGDYDGPIDPHGTSFQQEVWSALTRIPYGSTVSYGSIAEGIGSPKAVRAVGAANGANPLPILWPCHRVVGSTGKLTGFGGGLWRKEALLALEQGGRLF